MSAPDLQPIDNPESEQKLSELAQSPQESQQLRGPKNDESSEVARERFKDRVLEKIDDLLAGPRAVRLISGALFLVVAVVVSISQLSDLIERRNAAQHLTGDYQTEAGTHAIAKDNAAGARQAAKYTPQEEHLNRHLVLGDGKALIIPRPPSSSDHDGDALIVNYYTSDGCILVHRHQGTIETNDWSPDKTKNPQVSSAQSSGLRSFDPDRLRATLDLVKMQPYRAPRLLRVQGRCWNPHPGAFSWWWGPPTGCWVPMFRQFADGCLHHQMFNSCANYWDASIYWDRCLH